MAETILEPDLPIVDPHHHLWDRRNYAAPPSTAAAAPEHPFMTAIADARRRALSQVPGRNRSTVPHTVVPVGSCVAIGGAPGVGGASNVSSVCESPMTNVGPLGTGRGAARRRSTARSRSVRGNPSWR